MSVTFHPCTASGAMIPTDASPASCCLCAQDAPSWCYPGLGDPEDLLEHAEPSCPLCGGTGVEPGRVESLSLNLCNVNARALLALLGLAPVAPFVLTGPLPGAFGEPFDLTGQLTIPEARRAVMVARACFDRRARALTRAPEVLHGAPCVREDGAVELRPVRVMSPGFDAEALRDRLERFASLVEAGAAQGAVEIAWG